MKKVLITTIIVLTSLFFMVNLNRLKVSAEETTNEVQNFSDLYWKTIDDEFTFNITNITLSEIQNKGVMVEFQLNFEIEVGKITSINFTDNESCQFEMEYDVGSHSISCKYDNLDYDEKFPESEIEFEIVDINGEIVDSSVIKNSFKTRTVDPSSLKVSSFLMKRVLRTFLATWQGRYTKQIHSHSEN